MNCDKKDIVDYDFQGWPVYKMNLRSILEDLGFELKDGKWSIDDTNPMLDVYPRVLEDDGMGYGVNEKCITSFCSFESGGEGYCNVFVQKPIDKIDLWVDARFHPCAFIHKIDDEQKRDLTTEDVRKNDNGEYEYLCHWEIDCKETIDTDGQKKMIVTNDKAWFNENDLDWGWLSDENDENKEDEKE